METIKFSVEQGVAEIGGVQYKLTRIEPEKNKRPPIGVMVGNYSDSDDCCDKIESFEKLLAVADYVNGDWKPDFNDESQDKWRLGYSTLTGWDFTEFAMYSSTFVYFKSLEAGKEAVDIFHENGMEQELINLFIL